MKIHAQTSNSESTANIRKIVGENTPEFITQFIISTVNTFEGFRSGTAGTFINNPFAFYGLVLIIVILVVRYIWNLIFNI